MQITKEIVRKTAHLSRLYLDADAEQKMTDDLNKIIAWVDQLAEVDTEGVEPLRHMTAEVNILREDEVKMTLPHAEALRNAPKKDSDYFRVPKVLE